MSWCHCRDEISQNRLNRIRGIQNLDRLDESLYHDFESDEARKVRAPLPGALLLCTTLQPLVTSTIMQSCAHTLSRPCTAECYKVSFMTQRPAYVTGNAGAC